MEVKINKEIRNYTESIVLGLTLRQCFFSVLACVIAIIIYFSFINKLGLEITSWICIIGAVPFASLGFVTYQEMTFEKIILHAWKSLWLSGKKLIFKPVNLYYEILRSFIDVKRKESLGVNDKKLRKIKKTEQRKNKSTKIRSGRDQY